MGLLNSVGTVGDIASGKNLIGGEDGGIIGGAISNAGQYLGILDGKSLVDTFLDQGAISKQTTEDLKINPTSKNGVAMPGTLTWQSPSLGNEKASNLSPSADKISDGSTSFNIESLVKFPNWGYADFINERSVWQKGLSTPYGEPGYFYFKIFFDFDTDFGLLGGLLNRPSPLNTASSAAKYLSLCMLHYSQYKINDRLEALRKFASTLSYININAPWFFKSVKGLDKADIPVLEDMSKERTIEIELNPDAIDMRLSSLMALYKYACYDDINHLMILPDNLRKFDMSILIFETPIKYLHTAFKNGGLVDMAKNAVKGLVSGKKEKQRDYFSYKTSHYNTGAVTINGQTSTSKIKNTGWHDTMSFKLFTFLNCEIKLDSLGNMTPSSINNDQPFQMGNSSLTITYDKVLTTTSNEFMRMIWGSSGIYFTQYANIQYYANLENDSPGKGDRGSTSKKSEGTKFGKGLSKILGSDILGTDTGSLDSDLQQQRYKAIKKIHEFTPFLPPQTEKEVIDASEKVMHNNLTMLSGMGFGNLYGQDAGVSVKDLLGSDRHTTDYWDQKMSWLKNRKGHNNTSRDVIKAVSNILGTSDGANYRPTDVIGMSDEGISKYTDKSLSYWKDKLKALKGDDINTTGSGDGTVSVKRNDLIKKGDLSSQTKLQKPIKDMAKKMKEGKKDLQPNDWTINGTNKSKDHMKEYIDQERSNNFINRFGEGVAKYGVGTDYWFEKIRKIQEANLTTEQKHYIQEEIENMAVKLSTVKDGKATIPEYQSKIKEMASEMKDGTLDPGRSYDELILAMATKMKSGTLEPGRSYIELINAMAQKMKDGTLDPGRSYTELIAAMAQKMKDGTLDPGRSYTELIAAMAKIMKDGTLEPGRSYTELIAAMAQKMKDGTLEPGRSYIELIQAMAAMMKAGTLEPGRSYTELIQAMAEIMKHGTLEPGRSYTELIQAMAQKMKDGTLEPGRSYTELISAMAQMMKDGTLEPGRSYTELIQAMAQMIKDGTLEPGRSYVELIQAMAAMMKAGTLEPGRSYTELIQAMAQKMKDGTLEPGRSYTDLIQAMAEIMKHGTLEPGRSYTELIQAMAEIMKHGTLEPGRSYTELIQAMAEEMKKGTLEPGRSYTELIQTMAEMIKSGTLEPGRSYTELIQAMAEEMKKGTLEPGRDHIEEIQEMAEEIKKGTL